MKSTTRMLLVSAVLLATPAAAKAEAPRPATPMQRIFQIVQSIAPAARTASSAATSAAATAARPERLQARTGNTKRPSYDGTVACEVAEGPRDTNAENDAE